MSIPSRARVLFVAATVLQAMSWFSVSAAAGQPNCTAHTSPSATHKAFSTAAENNDWRTAYSFIDEKARGAFFSKTVTTMIFAWALDNNLERRTEFKRVLKANGFRFDDNGRLLDSDKDLTAIVQDWPKLMQHIAPYLKRWHGRAFHPNDSKLADVQIVGERATATVLTAGGSTKHAEFIKGRSGWCLVRSR